MAMPSTGVSPLTTSGAPISDVYCSSPVSGK